MQTSHVDSILRVESSRRREFSDDVVCEEPLEIRINGRPISVTMRTPGHDDELAAGFLLTEAVIDKPSDVATIESVGNRVNVSTAPGVSVDLDRLTRHVFASSSCGLCGKVTIESIMNRFGPVVGNMTIDAPVLLSLPDRMRENQKTFQSTGGLHAAAVFDATGNLVALREDVGRHNAVDKVLGFALRRGLLPLDRHVLLVSGRCSFEIVQKSLAARLPLVSSISAASSLAVDFARQCNQTLVAFLREQRMNIYSNPQRIRFEP